LNINTARKPLKIAIIIGLDYINNDYKLNGCINDTTLIVKLLVKNYDYQPEYIYLFTDYSKIKANKLNLIDLFNKIIKKDIQNILIYFSGHGNNNYILLENNEKLYDYEVKTYLLNKLLPNIRTIFILDCCKSGSFLKTSFFNNFFGFYSLNYFVLAACKNDQSTIEIYTDKSAYYGLFTFYLFELLNNNKNLSWNNLLLLLNKYIINQHYQEVNITKNCIDLNSIVNI